MKKNNKRFSGISKLPNGNTSNKIVPGCIVLEGGAFRGLYTSGVLDALMQFEINMQCTVGTSAGALNGFNYVAGQIGRSARINLGYRHDSRYVGLEAFKINKGIFSARDTNQVNESIAEDKKRIPFTQMIYVGDGETDVPCMKIVSMFGGHSIAVYNPENPGKQAVAEKLLRQGRVNFITPANYSHYSRTFKIVCGIIDKIKADWSLGLLRGQPKSKTVK